MEVESFEPAPALIVRFDIYARLATFGPRALGARAIMGDPRRQETQAQMNLKIKYRESFRPLAPSVRAEDVATYFEMDVESPYMLLVAPVRKEKQIQTGWKEALCDGGDDMLHVINQARSDISAITHVDLVRS